MKKQIATLITLLTSLNVYATTTPPALDGDYVMRLQIGETLFNDQLVLQGENGPIDIRFYEGQVRGSITVPGMFTADLTGHARCSEQIQKCQLNFSIIARENGKDFMVLYTATLNPADYANMIKNGAQPVLTGSAYLENEELLGHFTATLK